MGYMELTSFGCSSIRERVRALRGAFSAARRRGSLPSPPKIFPREALPLWGGMKDAAEGYFVRVISLREGLR